MKKIDEKELKELFIELRNNNQVAFEKLYTKYKKLIYGIAFSILKNNEDAEDIVQIVFSKLYKIDKNKLPQNKEESWLYTLTKNETISLLRKKIHNIDLDTVYEIENQDNEINNIIEQDRYNRLICKLNDKEKQIVSLKILGNLSFNEIAKLLNEPIGTIKWRYYKSMHTLKLLLSNLGMFIVTFVIGLKTLLNQDKINKTEQEIIKDEPIENNRENIENETSKSETSENQEEFRDKIQDINNSIKEDIKQEIIIQENIKESKVNYFGVGILSVSGIFLVLTIISTIFFTKYQLKGKKKASK